MERHLAAHRALRHPLWLSSLGLLVVNDHFLKGSGRLPAVLTGKLSDFAGLVVAPVLLAVLLRRSSRQSIVGAHVATGLVFAGINLFPAFARLFEALVGLTPFTWHITVDPTDLIALPMLFVSYHVLVPAMSRPTLERPVAQAGLVMAGAVACMATSQVQEPCSDPITCGTIPSEPAALVLGNTTDVDRLVRVRPLKSSVQVSCPELLADPTNTLSRELFGPAESWLLQPTRGLPLQGATNAECTAYLIDADGLSPVLLAWSSAQFPQTTLSTSTTVFDANKMVAMSLDSSGKLMVDDTHPAVFDAPPIEEAEPTAACVLPAKGVGVAWSTPLPSGGPVKIVSVESSPDDCHQLTLDNSPSMYVCIPAAAMPFQAGDLLEVQRVDAFAGASPETNGEFPRALGLLLRSATHTVLVVRGNVLARYAFTQPKEMLTEPSVEVDMVKGCPGSHDECGSLSIPLEISYLGDHVGGVSFVKAGSSLALNDGYGTLHVLRAEAAPVRDTACPPFADASRHYESVLVVPTAP